MKLEKLPETREDFVIHSYRTTDDSRRPCAVSLGVHCENAALPHPCPHDTETMMAGVVKRTGAKVPVAKPEVMERFRKFVKRWLEENLVPLDSTTDVSFETWLSGTTYPQWRKDQLRESYQNYLDHGLTERDKHCKSFQKDEFYESYKHARGINSRSDKFKTVTGPWFKVIEKVLYELPWFIKHVPVSERPKFLQERLGMYDKIFGTDYSSYECLFTPELIVNSEFQLYEYMLQRIPGFSTFLEVLQTIKGTNLMKFKHLTAEVQGRRMSGETCTSLGNGFTNLMAVLFLCSELGVEAKGCVEGDDGIFGTSGGIFPSVEDFASLGLVVKREECRTVGDASFCGLLFAKEDELNITEPLAEICTFGWASQSYLRSNEKKLSALLRCKSLSMLHQYPGCPILASLACYGLRVTADVTHGRMMKVIGEQSEWIRNQMLDAMKDMSKIKYREPPPATRLLMERRFGISIQTQLDIEAYFDGLSSKMPLSLGHLISFPPDWTDYCGRYCKYSDVNDVWALPSLRESRIPRAWT